jgi:hypothetical protein
MSVGPLLNRSRGAGVGATKVGGRASGKGKFSSKMGALRHVCDVNQNQKVSDNIVVK